MKLERGLVAHCAPTLASLKTGSLFNAVHGEDESVEQQVEQINRQLEPRGVRLAVLRRGQKGSLIYVFRPRDLDRDLSRSDVADFLHRCGYEKAECSDSAVCRLCQRLREQKDFPHEIGVFLGYPLEDVEAFIENGGKNAECTGCWQVYCNEEEAQRRFSQFKKCSEVYRRCWEGGRSLEKLTVAS